MTALLRWSLALACLSVPVARPVRAQTDVPPDGLRLTPTVRLNYDDNVLRRDAEYVSGPRDDWRITPGVDLTLRQQGGAYDLMLVGSLGYDFYNRFDNLNRERISLLANGSLRATGSCHIRPRIRLDFAQSNLSDQGDLIGNSQRTQDYRLRFDCDKPYRLTPVLAVGYLTTKNSADRRRVFNIDTQSATAGLAYAKPSLGALELTATYERFRRPHADESRPGLREGAENYSIGLLFRRSVAPRLSWRLGGRYLRTDARASGVADFSGFGYEAGVDYVPSSRFSLSLESERSSRNQSNTGAAYIVETDVTLRAGYRIGTRSALSGGGTVARRRFHGELLLDTPYTRRSDTTAALFLGYRYRLRDRLHLGADLRHEWRTGKADYFNYTSTAAMLSIGVQL